MSSCEEIIQKLFEENPNLTDKEIIAKMKELKDEKGKRLYKTSTIASRLRQFRVKQRVPSELPEIEKTDEDISIDASKSDAPELKNVNLERAKKEIEEAFGRRDEMNKEEKEVHVFDFFGRDLEFVEQKIMSQDDAEAHATKTDTVFKLNVVNKKVEPQELKSGHKKYDGRTDPDHARKEIDALLREPKKHSFPAFINKHKKPQGTTHDVDSVNKKILSAIECINGKIDVMNKEIRRLQQEGSSVVVDELVDVQLRESIISKLDALKADDSHDLNETLGRLIELNNEMKDVAPSFLKKISLDKKGSVHGKLFMHDNKWKFVKRAKPIIYGIVGIAIGSLSVFVMLVLLRAVGVLPGWI